MLTAGSCREWNLADSPKEMKAHFLVINFKNVFELLKSNFALILFTTLTVH